MKTFAILGRQPKIGMAELESLYGADSVAVFSDSCSFVKPEIDYRASLRLGSVIKVGQILEIGTYTNWQLVSERVIATFKELAKNGSAGKLTIGTSVYGLNIKPKEIENTGLTVKRTLKKAGFSIRLVPNKQASLSTAQVLHNKLDGRAGIELVVFSAGTKFFIGKTTYEQDIEAYTARDQARPKRDAFVGMLPPKLAQTIINLANGKLNAPKNLSESTLLDPFCGTGVVLQEALLMGYSVVGTDISSKMINYSQENIEWLKEKFQRISQSSVDIEKADATNFSWPQKIDLVAGETYLGSPISMMPDPLKLSKLLAETDGLHKKTLQNLASQLKPGTRLCLAVPAWRTKNGFKHLPTLDQLSEIGYNRIDFKYAKAKDLIYIRESQFVGRELVVLEKI